MNDIKARRILAVTGYPVLHSKSPVIFNAAFTDQEKTARYTRLAATSAAEAILLMRRHALAGINVTAPFKKDMISLMDRVDAPVRDIGGVNTVVMENDSLTGYNTDYLGVVDSLRKRKIAVAGRRCVVLGAGGAGRAAAYGLVGEKARVTIVNRTWEKAAAAAQTLGCGAGRIESLRSLVDAADILISTLSAQVQVVEEEFLRDGLVVFDANYRQSPIPAMAARKGCTVITGEEWLLNQAIPAYRLFTAQEPPAGVMEKAFFSSDRGDTAKKNVLLLGTMGRDQAAIGQGLAKELGGRFILSGHRDEIRHILEKESGWVIHDPLEKVPGDEFLKHAQDHAWVIFLSSAVNPALKGNSDREDLLPLMAGRLDAIVDGEKAPAAVQEHIFRELVHFPPFAAEKQGK